MLCNMVMRPALIFAGILIVAVSAVALLAARRGGPVSLDLSREAGSEG
jgi:hypothetical protein